MQIGYANVFVRDLDRAMKFFEETLGLAKLHGDPAHGYAAFAAGPVSIGLAVPGPDQGDLIGRHTGLGFVVDDLDAAHADLAAKGVRFEMEPTRQPWGGYMALFADADDNVYYLDQPSAAHG